MKKVFILTWLVVLIAVGVGIGRQFAPNVGGGVPSDHRHGSRYWARISDGNPTFGPGELIVDGKFGVGTPDLLDHSVEVQVEVSDAEGNLLFQDHIGTVHCPAKMSYIDFPVHKAYQMPSGYYKVKLACYHGAARTHGAELASAWRSYMVF